MSKVFNMVGGGGGGGKNISSIIITGLESTDTITCTKDGRSYTATWDSTAQHWEIIGLPLGAFTVTATNVAKTTTETVLIDIAGVYEIEMAFKLWLYRDGDECEDVTGGWTNQGYSASGSASSITPNITNTRIVLSTDSDLTICYVGTANKINVSRFTKLYCILKDVSIIGTYAGCNILLCSSQSGFNSNASKWVDVAKQTSSEIQVEMDLSEKQDSYYIAIDVFGATSKVELSQIWLE